MEAPERKYLLDHGFDIKSPFDAEAVEIIMKEYAEAKNKDCQFPNCGEERFEKLEAENKELVRLSKIDGNRMKESQVAIDVLKENNLAICRISDKIKAENKELREESEARLKRNQTLSRRLIDYDELKAENKDLKGYAKHKVDCGWWKDGGKDYLDDGCTCGLDKLLTNK